MLVAVGGHQDDTSRFRARKILLNAKPKIVVIHGTGGQPGGNWFPWLKRRLASAGCKTIAPSFPTPDGQSLTAWKKVFQDQVGDLQPNMILIGHSLGAGFVLNLLEESSVPVLATISVCGFVGNLGLPEYDQLNKTFVDHEFNWRQIRNNMGKTTLFCSDNDPYVPITKSQELSSKLQIPLTVITGAKHINSEAGYFEFPAILEEIQNCLGNSVSSK